MRAVEQMRRPVVGLFRVWARRGGELLYHCAEPNLVVDAIDDVLPRCAVGSVSINTIGIGSDNTAPAAGDTELTDEWTRTVQSVDHPATNKVRFTWTIFESEGPSPDMTVREFGLFASDGTLCARKVLAGPGVLKEAGVQLEGDWTLAW
jgi:hypothetical protein